MRKILCNTLRQAELRLTPCNIDIADAALHTVKTTHEFACEYGVRRPVCENLSGADGNEPLCAAYGLVEIVQYHDNGEAERIMKLFHELHESELVTDVEIRCRLVEE